MIKSILWHKGVMMMCVPIAGVGGVGAGVVKADAIKSAYHRVVDRKPRAKRVVQRRVTPPAAVSTPAVAQCPPAAIFPVEPLVGIPIEPLSALTEPKSGNTGSFTGGGYTPIGGIGVITPGGSVTPPPPIITPPVSVVPETGTWVMLISGTALAGGLMRSARRQKSSVSG